MQSVVQLLLLAPESDPYSLFLSAEERAARLSGGRENTRGETRGERENEQIQRERVNGKDRWLCVCTLCTHGSTRLLVSSAACDAEFSIETFLRC